MNPVSNAFGRVDEENNVFVIDAGTERKVGQYPGVAMEEAMAYFERKYQELEANVRILEQRVKNNADPLSVAKAVEKLTAELVEPAVVGDLADLRKRVAVLAPDVEALKAEKAAALKQAIDQALALRNDIAQRAKELAERDPKKTQWKHASKEMTELFEKWQTAQKNGVKVPRKESDAIWKVFSQARTKFEANKRAFFASLTAETKVSRAKKAELTAKAEALVAKGAKAANDYRKLLEEWKSAGRSNGKADDALWARFKAAGDAIYALRKEELATESVEQAANLETKLAIIAEAEKIDPTKDLSEAKKQLLTLQQRFEKAGKVPKDKIRSTEDRMRAVEKKIRDAENEAWRKSDPETIERTNGVLSQLEESIAKLESELSAARAASSSEKVADLENALAARKSWLDVVKQNAS